MIWIGWRRAKDESLDSFSLPNWISRCLEGQSTFCRSNHPCRSSLQLQCTDYCLAGTIWKTGCQKVYKNKKDIQNLHRKRTFCTNIFTFQDEHSKRFLNDSICFSRKHWPVWNQIFYFLTMLGYDSRFLIVILPSFHFFLFNFVFEC